MSQYIARHRILLLVLPLALSAILTKGVAANLQNGAASALRSETTPVPSLSPAPKYLPDALPVHMFTSPLTTNTAVTTKTATLRFKPSESLLDRLAKDKPSIWGRKSFYIGIAILYVALLSAFLWVLVRLAGTGNGNK